MSSDARTDDYIARAPPFAQPILHHLRATMHRVCPSCEEAIKWGRPFFMLDGRPLAMMAAFKAHAIFGFWQGGAREASGREAEAGGQFGRITTLADLPAPPEMEALIRQAAESAGTPPPPKAKKPPPGPAAMPPDLAVALAANAAAATQFAAFPPGRQREYLAWIDEAKRAETRARRIETTVTQSAEGKSLNWKY